MISVLVLRASFSRMKILSLLPVVAGVGFAYVSSASPLAAAEKILISATQKLIDCVFLKSLSSVMPPNPAATASFPIATVLLLA
jgi:hypothetical protein